MREILKITAEKIQPYPRYLRELEYVYEIVGEIKEEWEYYVFRINDKAWYTHSDTLKKSSWVQYFDSGRIYQISKKDFDSLVTPR